MGAIEEIRKRHEIEMRKLRISREIDVDTIPTTISNDDIIFHASLEFEYANEEPMLFYDRYSQRFFESTFSKVLQAEYHLNRNFVAWSAVTVNEFYDFLGIPPVEYEFNKGWSMEDGIYWVDFSHVRKFNYTGQKYYEIQMIFEPEMHDEDSHMVM